MRTADELTHIYNIRSQPKTLLHLPLFEPIIKDEHNNIHLISEFFKFYEMYHVYPN